jgi:low temperature requirement protein LtrA
MTAGGGGTELLRREHGGPGQLFFDLVYVFAFTRIAQRLFEDLTGPRHIVLTSVCETTLLFLAIWLVWSRGEWVFLVPPRPVPRRHAASSFAVPGC